jgi:hypothetical protein
VTGNLPSISRIISPRLLLKVVTSLKNKKYNKINLTIKPIKISIPKLRAHSAETLWRKELVPMATNASLLMALLS